MSQSQSLRVSARSLLIAGVSTAVVGAAVVSPASVPALSPAKVASALSLVSVTTPLENGIKDIYTAVEPWAAWGAELGQWALGFVPGLWWVAPGIDLAYFSIEPLVQAGVFTFADIVGLDFAQIGPDIASGITEAGQNFVNYGLAWLNSLVPFPPLPPFPPGPFAASSVVAPAAASLTAGPRASSITTPIEVAIKSTYNWAEGWTNYAMQWADYVLGLVPVVNWFAPAIPLVYNTVEPLVQAGVYTIANLIGLNFAAIGPDIRTGISASINNAIQGVLNWINIPLPPRPPVAAAAAARTAAPLAAAAVKQVETEKVDPSGSDAPDAVASPAKETGKETGNDTGNDTGKDAGNDTGKTEIQAPAADAADTPATGEAPRPARSRRGHSAPAAASDSTADAGSSASADRPHRGARSHN